MNDAVAKRIPKISTRPGVDKCVFCLEAHSSIDLKGRGRDVWNCRRCRRVNVTVDYRGEHFTRAAVELERARNTIKHHERIRMLFDPKHLTVPHPGHFQTLSVAAREEVLARIEKLEQAHKNRRLGIVLSWDFQPGTWGATVSFNPLQGPGRGYFQVYGSPTAERVIEGLEKKLNEEKILNDDSRFSFSISLELYEHMEAQLELCRKKAMT